MRFFKQLFLFLIFLAVAAFALSFMAPTQQKVEKSIVINATPAEVYKQMMLLQNFNNWSVWSKADSTVKYTTEGKDGMVGTKVSWEGSPVIAGKGEITLKELQQDKLIRHDINLLEPNTMKAFSQFQLNPVGKQTEVRWTFTVPSDRPFNIINLFYDLDKEKGGDFEAGLSALKLMVEKMPLADPKALKVTSSHFPFTNYVGIKQTVLWVDYPTFFQQHFNHLSSYVLKGKYPGAVKSALIFENDNKLHQSELAAAFPIPTGQKPELNAPEEFIEVAASKSVEITFTGKEDVKQQAYLALDKFMAEKKLTQKMPVIEQFLKEDSLPKTRIIYLVD